MAMIRLLSGPATERVAEARSFGRGVGGRGMLVLLPVAWRGLPLPAAAPLGSCLRRNDEKGGGGAGASLGAGLLDTGIRRYEGLGVRANGANAAFLVGAQGSMVPST